MNSQGCYLTYAADLPDFVFYAQQKSADNLRKLCVVIMPFFRRPIDMWQLSVEHQAIKAVTDFVFYFSSLQQVCIKVDSRYQSEREKQDENQISDRNYYNVSDFEINFYNASDFELKKYNAWDFEINFYNASDFELSFSNSSLMEWGKYNALGFDFGNFRHVRFWREVWFLNITIQFFLLRRNDLLFIFRAFWKKRDSELKFLVRVRVWNENFNASDFELKKCNASDFEKNFYKASGFGMRKIQRVGFWFWQFSTCLILRRGLRFKNNNSVLFTPWRRLTFNFSSFLEKRDSELKFLLRVRLWNEKFSASCFELKKYNTSDFEINFYNAAVFELNFSNPSVMEWGNYNALDFDFGNFRHVRFWGVVCILKITIQFFLLRENDLLSFFRVFSKCVIFN